MTGGTQQGRSGELTRDQSRLGYYFLRSGFVRVPHAERLGEGYDVYKKGWEVRLSLDGEELEAVRDLIARVGLRPASPYRKSGGWIQPVYGERAVRAFEEWARTVGR